SRKVTGRLNLVNSRSTSPFASKCGTLYFPINVGIRLSDSGTHLRVSSSVDQMTCFTSMAFAASAWFLACAYSFSGEKCSQKLVRQKTPYAPAKARFRPAASSKSAATTSAPSLARALALSEFISLVNARAIKVFSGSLAIARTSPPPCIPVAPTTAMIFFSAMRNPLKKGVQTGRRQLHDDPTTDLDRLPCHPSSILAHDERDDIGNIFRNSKSLHRRQLNADLLVFLRHHLGFSKTRRNGIHRNPPWSQFLRQSLSVLLQRCLAP